MNVISDRLTSRLLQDQMRQCEDEIFLDVGGDFQVFDVTQHKIESTSIRSEEDFSNLLSQPVTIGTRIISISADSTIEPLNISFTWCARLFEAYQVRPEFLQVLLAFGNEPLRAEACSASNAYFPTWDNGYCLSYKLNFVEPNKRGGRDPWSRRHLGVYHHHTSESDLYILLHCTSSSALYQQLAPAAKNGGAVERLLTDIFEHPGSLHDAIMACYIHNWRFYLRDMGDEVSGMNDEAMVAKVTDPVSENHALVRRLRKIRDRVSFTSACCLSNLEALRSICKSRGDSTRDMHTSMLPMAETMINGYIQDSKSLQDGIDNTIELISYTLAVHNQEETAKLDKETRNLAEETSRVTVELKSINESSANDSAIISIITILSAIYVPGSFVAVSLSSHSLLNSVDLFFPSRLTHFALACSQSSAPTSSSSAPRRTTSPSLGTFGSSSSAGRC